MPGVSKARECLLELNTAQTLLRRSLPDDGQDEHAPGEGGSSTTTCSGGGDGGGKGCDGHDQTHSHSHGHHGHAPSAQDGVALTGPASGRGGGGTGGGGDDAAVAGGREGEVKAMARAMTVVRRAKATCRVAEGACLLRGGRAAEATEALRDLLFEVGAPPSSTVEKRAECMYIREVVPVCGVDIVERGGVYLKASPPGFDNVPVILKRKEFDRSIDRRLRFYQVLRARACVCAA